MPKTAFTKARIEAAARLSGRGRRAEVFAASILMRRKAPAPLDSYALKLAVVHEGAEAAGWAARVIDRAVAIVGEKSVHIGCWTAEELSDPALLSRAIRDAAAADLLMVALPAAEALPGGLYAWLIASVARRSQPGLLVALLGVAPRHSAVASRLRLWLRGLARSSRLEFLACQQNPRAALAESATAPIMKWVLVRSRPQVGVVPPGTRPEAGACARAE